MLSAWQKFVAILNKWRWKAVDTDKVYGYQCVDWVKQFAFEQYGVTLKSFSWSALRWWLTWSPFDSTWQRIDYKPWRIPEIWDIVFLNNTLSNPYWHVCVADNHCDYRTLHVIEQNAGSGNGSWKWTNAIRQSAFPYQNSGRWNCLGWFHRK